MAVEIKSNGKDVVCCCGAFKCGTNKAAKDGATVDRVKSVEDIYRCSSLLLAQAQIPVVRSTS